MGTVLAFHQAVAAAPCVSQTDLADDTLRNWARRMLIRDDVACGRYADAHAELGRLWLDAARAPARLAAVLFADHDRLAAQLRAAAAADAEDAS